ncbi:MAG: aminodeoxychorismate synthase component I [Nitrospinaceae bacterium]|nr:anthranilate synthase component I family protein [Nitrospinaceae bacterium]NIR54335.1 anthranilate synthase component I family protein [Nitrospinaceae bacterium]NIS84753.1 anthranilate synthase component I family protein [Nitrospinaceae bacterium]NIT81554.1 anthranilate synthase component I family protein [Nitrospinaceae bacterium]NIU43839.1 anthranilate synthase component I family protein [Nitrospinaceae bacterium]
MTKLPSRQRYIDLSRTAKRIPILEERPVPGFDPAFLFRGLYGQAPLAFLFESGKGPEATARYTFLGQSNGRALVAEKNSVTLIQNGVSKVVDASPLAAFEQMNFRISETPPDYVNHFWGGWVGYIGYEMAGCLETLIPAGKDDPGLPLLHFFQVDRLWVYDHMKETLKLIFSEEISGNPGNHYDRTRGEMQTLWRRAEAFIRKFPPSHGQPPTQSSDGKIPTNLHSNVTQNHYVRMVESAKRYIEEGDIYQANLSQRFETAFDGDPWDLYEPLRQINPAPFSGFMRMGDVTLVSSSPERLVRVEGKNLETRPIAGTRPRGQTEKEDHRLAEELLLNEKEQAEHTMLVDLERNDLGRICEYGSVQVTDTMFVEKYSHVSHIVSNIRGTLKPRVNLLDIIRAVFPGGTITGCPKIRCMEIISELEPAPRGPYSGSFGYIGFSDYLDLNIVIRTLVISRGKASFHVGAGIVADSIPEKEYQETLDKAAAMIHVLTGLETAS